MSMEVLRVRAKGRAAMLAIPAAVSSKVMHSTGRADNHAGKVQRRYNT